MNTELSGPISVEALAEFPKSGLWKRNMAIFLVKHEMTTELRSIQVGGLYQWNTYKVPMVGSLYPVVPIQASASDPVDQEKE